MSLRPKPYFKTHFIACYIDGFAVFLSYFNIKHVLTTSTAVYLFVFQRWYTNHAIRLIIIDVRNFVC